MAMKPDDYYKKCNLKSNPFRSTPNAASDPRASIWIGYKQQKRLLEKYFLRSLSDQIGNANFLMLFGDYGTGKSHALLWAQNMILHARKEEFDSACYFIPTLRQDKGKLTFAGAFLFDLMQQSHLVKDVKAFHYFLTMCISAFRESKNLDIDTITPEMIIKDLIPEVTLHNFAIKIYKEIDDVHAFLTNHASTDYQAMITFTHLVNLFVYEIEIPNHTSLRFKKGVYLFIDELDDLDRSTVKEAREVNDLLRHIYDKCPSCFCMVIALSAEISQLSVYFFDYVLSRIIKQIELIGLDKNDAVIFVKEILESNRINPKHRKQFFPFKEEAIDSIAAHLTEITPRSIINIMQEIIEDVRLAGHNPDDGAVSREFLDTHEILDEIVG